MRLSAPKCAVAKLCEVRVVHRAGTVIVKSAGTSHVGIESTESQIWITW